MWGHLYYLAGVKNSMPLVTRRAEQGSLFSNPTEPTDKTNGNLWIDTSSDAPTLAVSNGTNYVGPKILINTQKVPIEAML